MYSHFWRIIACFLKTCFDYIKTSATCFIVHANCMYTDYVTIKYQINYIIYIYTLKSDIKKFLIFFRYKKYC